MRNWKKSLLLAAGFAVLIPSAAMATQKNSEQTDTVTVEVKNVKGGALYVTYKEPEYGFEKTLPIGEKVDVPKGTELTINYKDVSYMGETDCNIKWYSPKYDEYVKSNLEELYAIDENGKEEIEFYADRDDTTWRIEKDCVIEGKFEARTRVDDYGQEEWSTWYDVNKVDYHKTYNAPSVIEVNLSATCRGEKIKTSEVPNIEIGKTFDKEDENYRNNFEITDDGIRSKGVMPMGVYQIPYTYSFDPKDLNKKRTRSVMVFVGKKVFVGWDLATYEYRPGEMQSVCGITSWTESKKSGMKNPNADMESWAEYPELAFDAEKTTIGDIIGTRNVYDENDPEQVDVSSEIAGYKLTNGYTDFKGNRVDKNTKTTLKAASKDGHPGCYIYEVYKRGAKTYTPATIQLIPDNEVKVTYRNSIVEENGKLYYYDSEGEKVFNQWAYLNEDDEWVFCSADGSLITNGIAGISMDDEMGLWYMNEKGRIDEEYTNPAYEKGNLVYEIKEGKVISISPKTVKTPSNATELNDRVSEFEKTMSEMSDEQRNEYADKISTGFAGLSKTEKDKVDGKQIEDMDAVLEKAYGVNAEDYVEFSAENDVEKEMILDSDEVKVTGVLAAAGVTSDTLGETRKIKITQLAASASNAAASKNEKPVLRFKAELFVNNVKKQINGPVIIEITLPDQFKNTYTKDAYTFVIKHVMDDETKENITPEFSDDFTTMTLRANSFSTFELLATKKDSGNSGDNKDDNTSGGNTSGGNTSGGNTSGGNTSGENTSGGNTSGGSTSGGSSSGGSSSKKVKTYHAPAQKTEETIGKWQQDQNGWWFRFNNGSWPKNQWIELIWNGTSSWYYFNEKGYMETSWHKDGDEWYYLNPESDGTRGAMVTGWKQINNIWYYFSTVAGGPKGAMLSNTVTPDGYRIGADGAWVK